jgi:hypothetical protein
LSSLEAGNRLGNAVLDELAEQGSILLKVTKSPLAPLLPNKPRTPTRPFVCYNLPCALRCGPLAYGLQ